MVRVVRTPSGTIQVDPTGKLSGRGAYLCSAPECWAAGLRRGVLTRALKVDVLAAQDVEALTRYAAELRPMAAPEVT